MSDSASQPTVALTGANGYLGRCCAERFREAGWRVRMLLRDKRDVADSVEFQLGQPVPPGSLRDAQALVHCAYDFAPTQREDIERVNVHGSIELLDAAHASGIEKIVYVSSISAFSGCRSLYGQAKLAVENHAHRLRAFVIRPGLIFDDPPGGAFAGLVEQVCNSRIVPLIGNGSQIQYLVHNDDLATFILRCCRENMAPPSEPITIAHPHPWPLRELLLCIAEQSRRNPLLLPTPWRLIWGALKTAEVMGLPIKFRSDSVISLVNQNPRPDFNTATALGVVCRPFP